MDKNEIEFIENEAFEKKVNIELCNKLINYIIKISDNDYRSTLKNISDKCIWFKSLNNVDMQKDFQVKYLGELLERYEEKIGDNTNDIRAIALALGFTAESITNNMIVGNQLVNFITKINTMAKDDIYLQGALYLYNNKKNEQYKTNLLKNHYLETEDLIFVLSLFDDIEKIYTLLRDQIIELLGKKRTIGVINNIKLYSWFINRFYSIIKKDRKKDAAILKSLLILPTQLIKSNNSNYTILISNNYKEEEILYLNYGFLYYSLIPKTVRMGNSITEERIAINLCKTLLDSEYSCEESLYKLIDSILKKYEHLDIKIRTVITV